MTKGCVLLQCREVRTINLLFLYVLFRRTGFGKTGNIAKKKTVKVEFSGLVSWYSVCVKNHLEATGIMETYMEKGKKMHRLKKMII